MEKPRPYKPSTASGTHFECVVLNGVNGNAEVFSLSGNSIHRAALHFRLLGKRCEKADEKTRVAVTAVQNRTPSMRIKPS